MHRGIARIFNGLNWEKRPGADARSGLSKNLREYAIEKPAAIVGRDFEEGGDAVLDRPRQAAERLVLSHFPFQNWHVMAMIEHKGLQN